MTKRVLIVEDSSTIRDQLRRILTPEGFDVLEARDGLEGLEMAREHDDVAMKTFAYSITYLIALFSFLLADHYIPAIWPE